MQRFTPGHLLPISGTNTRPVVMMADDKGTEETVALCYLPCNAVTPYVTWVVSSDGKAAYWGHYHSNLVSATLEFIERAGLLDATPLETLLTMAEKGRITLDRKNPKMRQARQEAVLEVLRRTHEDSMAVERLDDIARMILDGINPV